MRQPIMFDRRLITNFDFIFLALIFLACGIGILAVYSATYAASRELYLKQVYWLAAGLVAMLVILTLDYRTATRYAWVFYVINIILLLIVMMRGANRVERWINVAGVKIQPSEFMKVTMALVWAQYFQRMKDKPPNLGHILIAFAILAPPLALIIKQPDLGTAMVFVPVFLTVLLIAGVKLYYIIGILTLGVASMPVVWGHLKSYQRARLATFLNPDADPLGTGYHVMQSKIALGSGGFRGKGFLMGTQNKLKFLPAQHTDFIFSVVGEEWGFIGTFLTIVLLAFIIFRGMDIALKSKDRTGTILAAAIISTMAFQSLINLGMVAGMMPVTGIPLPLISYGGSSLIVTFVGLGFLLNIRMRKFMI